eukprot:SAG22_NODE_19563_length_273_cov_1.649425_2_plen_34_part_01
MNILTSGWDGDVFRSFVSCIWAGCVQCQTLVHSI